MTVISEPTAVRPLRRGDRGPHVRALRELISRIDASTHQPRHRADDTPGAEDSSAHRARTFPGPAAPDGGQAGHCHRPVENEDVFDEGLERAVRAFQQRRGLMADGVVGSQTARALDFARWRLGDRSLLYTPGHLMRGDDVAALQERLLMLGLLSGPVDAVFGAATDGALRELQSALGLRPDGHCGPATLRAMGNLGRAVGGGDPWALRQQAAVASAGKSLAGKVVVIDPAHGGDDHGVQAHGLDEAALVLDLARRIEGRLAATGVTAVLTRGGAAGPATEDAQRAELAEAVGADVLVSLHCDAHLCPTARGVATFYWGDDRVGSRSAVGERLASILQREVVARTRMQDCRTHPRTFDILRLTRMPAVRLELGYLTNGDDAALLRHGPFRDTVADAVVVAVQRLYLVDEDAVTGTLRLDDVIAQSARH